jgi:hypothetical protein
LRRAAKRVAMPAGGVKHRYKAHIGYGMCCPIAQWEDAGVSPWSPLVPMILAEGIVGLQG